ncbi:hypothetical protein [Streptococcus moroccensis]|uniref:hypothetical protein n=1 Tax=Streptococcus moroccensis TaxID=1451356 RepID=UPI0035224998
MNSDRKKNRRNGNDRYRPKYHASVPSGWANDPNGLIWFDGKAHLFDKTCREKLK